MDKNIDESLVHQKSLDQLKKAQGTVELQYCDSGVEKYVMTYGEFAKQQRKKFNIDADESQSILESNGNTTYTIMYELSCDKWYDILNEVYDDDEYEGDKYLGKSHYPHLTIMYGLTGNVSINEYSDVVDNIKNPVSVNATGISLFESKDYDVLIIEVEVDKQTHILNNIYSKYENVNIHPFKPHITISHIVKGEAQKYIDIINLEGVSFKVECVIISDEDRNDFKVDIK